MAFCPKEYQISSPNHDIICHAKAGGTRSRATCVGIHAGGTRSSATCAEIHSGGTRSRATCAEIHSGGTRSRATCAEKNIPILGRACRRTALPENIPAKGVQAHGPPGKHTGEGRAGGRDALPRGLRGKNIPILGRACRRTALPEIISVQAHGPPGCYFKASMVQSVSLASTVMVTGPAT